MTEQTTDGVDIDAVHAAARTDHGRAGSPTALGLLLALHAYPRGCDVNALATHTGLPSTTCSLGLRGLQERGRAVCTGRGRHARWFTADHFKRNATNADQR